MDYSAQYADQTVGPAGQDDLKYFEASEDRDEEFYAGGGQYRRHGLEHFPQLWCHNGSYSVYGQVRPHACECPCT